MVGKSPSDIQINQDTGKIYVANQGSDTVTVIDSESGSINNIRVGVSPGSIAIDRMSDKIYVTNTDSPYVSVIDGVNDSILSLLNL